MVSAVWITLKDNEWCGDAKIGRLLEDTKLKIRSFLGPSLATHGNGGFESHIILQKSLRLNRAF